MLKDFNSLEEMEIYISSQIHGAFSIHDMTVITDYVKKLQAGDQYLEIGVDFGKSSATAIFQAPAGVKFTFIDIVDRQAPADHPELKSRAQFFADEGFNNVGTFIQADANEIAKTWDQELAMIFIDGDHSYEGCSKDILSWEPFLKSGGFMLFHDYDVTSPGVLEAVRTHLTWDKYTDFFIAPQKYPNCRSSIVGATKK